MANIAVSHGLYTSFYIPCIYWLASKTKAFPWEDKETMAISIEWKSLYRWQVNIPSTACALAFFFYCTSGPLHNYLKYLHKEFHAGQTIRRWSRSMRKYLKTGADHCIEVLQRKLHFRMPHQFYQITCKCHRWAGMQRKKENLN